MNIRKDYEKLFGFLAPPQPREELLGKIMARIQTEQYMIVLKRRIAFFSVLFLGSLVAFIPTFMSMYRELAQSGSLSFISLVFSDPIAVFTSGTDFLASIMESLPTLSISAFLLSTLVFLGSLKFLTKDMAAVFAPVRFKNS